MSTFVSELSGSLIFRSGSSEQTSLVPKANALALTGSLNITGSSLTFNGSDLISRIVNLEAGTGGGSSIGPLNLHSASINTFTSSYYTDSASFDSRIDAVESTTSTNSSAITQLQSNTSSYISSTSQLTDSGFLTSSNSSIVSSSGQIAAFGYITSASVAVPAGTVSSSAQISALGYITGSPENTISSSQQIIDLGFSTDDVGVFIETGSFFATTNDLQVSGSFRVSGSVAANSFISTDGTGQPTLSSNSNLILSASDAVIIRNALLRPGRFTDSETGSLAAIDGDILFNTSSYKLQFYSGSAFYDIGASNIPAGTISSSQQIEDLGFVTSSGGSSTDITALNTFTASYYVDSASFSSRIDTVTVDTSSLDTRITSLETFSSSLDTNFATDAELSALSASAHVARLNITASSADTTGLLTTASYQIDSASFDSRISSINASGDTSFDGDRIVSNEDLGDLFTNSFNAGTTGSIQDFLTALFFPNTAPSFTSTGSFFSAEYTTSGSVLGTLSATDSEGQSVTFRANSAYTAGLVAVASDGTLTLAQAPTGEDYNTVDRGDGVYAHPVQVDAVDTFGGFTTTTVYVVINVNNAPVFRQTSTSGPIITSFTSSRNENASSGLVGRIYFTDADGDSITIRSSSVSDHFSITKYSTYVQIDQVTGSLDYETTSSYQYSITASDEHYEAGDDLAASASLLITLNVTDNVIPVVNNQTLGTINENSSNGATVGTIAASDAEDDTITFRNFELSSMQLDGVDVSTGSYGGTAQLTDPHEDPFQMTSAGTVTRKSGVYINSDLVNKYIYSVEVVDSYNTASDAGLITINISDDTPAVLSDNWSSGPFIKESAVANDNIVTTSGGSTQADYGSNQSGTWSSSNSDIAIDSNGRLKINTNISGSSVASGDTISSTITFTNGFGTTTTDSLNVSVTANAAPVASFTNQGSNFNTNLATQNTNLVSVSITDTESDTPYSLTLGGSHGNLLNAVPQNAASSSWQLQAASDFSAGTYIYDVTVTDNFGKSTTYTNRSLPISAANTGTLSVGNLYVIESALSGDIITTNGNGRSGTAAQVSVSYTPNYGSQVAQNFQSSNGLVAINSSTGVLTVGSNISGSGNVNGDTITTNLSWEDQYGNSATSSVGVQVAENYSPVITRTNNSSNLNTNLATSGSTLVTLSFADAEGDAINYNSFVGTESNGLNFKRSGANFLVQPTGSLAADTYYITASIRDEHGFSATTVGHNFTIAQASTGTLTGTSIYSIESAVSGNSYRTATGYNQGSAAQLSVGYSPSYGSPVVQSFTSSNAAIAVDNSGNLTLGVNLSGSATQSGDTITSTITYRDQYDNIGSGTVTATIFGNQSPSANFTAASDYNTDAATSGSTAGTLTVSDTESNTPFTITLGGTDGGKFAVNGTSSPYTIRPTGSLDAATYTINITVADDYDETVTLTGETITVTQAADVGKVYVYDIGFWDGTYNNNLGIQSVGSQTIPVATSYTGYGFIEKIEDGNLGDSSFTYSWGSTRTATLLESGSDGTSVGEMLQNMSTISRTNSNRFVILAPSGSDLVIPTTMTDGYGGSTVGEYVLEAATDGTALGSGLGTSEGSSIHKVNLGSAHLGFSSWVMIGANNQIAGTTSLLLDVRPSSGSAPS